MGVPVVSARPVWQALGADRQRQRRPRPRAALRAGPDTRYLVMEKGARGIGHVRYLCELVP
ncbi:hypothetical protein AB0A95_08440, partial [Micromonospora sp. NPDC049230]|uniref:hypothetical protein n=1 Tax=Micromonospora sp. NPDC049230 TaxID=3155502 RepID=UPI00340782ED